MPYKEKVATALGLEGFNNTVCREMDLGKQFQLMQKVLAGLKKMNKSIEDFENIVILEMVDIFGFVIAADLYDMHVFVLKKRFEG